MINTKQIVCAIQNKINRYFIDYGLHHPQISDDAIEDSKQACRRIIWLMVEKKYSLQAACNALHRTLDVPIGRVMRIMSQDILSPEIKTFLKNRRNAAYIKYLSKNNINHKINTWEAVHVT